ncbi:hypothetical protein [Tannockella kyphosi]|uniref:hypothetical protein n=1 Tax=Tannockella kyphosi TaxID=2899121 RepID=UPI002011F7B3|nr:hypothetical protein [Tannockella kyphosi]
MNTKKTIKIVGVMLGFLLILSIRTGIFDYFRVYSAEKPIFTIPVTADDGGSGTYYGLGYQIEIKGNFMPEEPIPGIKYVEYSILGIPVKEIAFE